MSGHDYLALARAYRTKHELHESDEGSPAPAASSHSSDSFFVAEPGPIIRPPTVHRTAGYVLVAGLDNPTRHRVMVGIADAGRGVRMATRRHNYRAGTLTIVAADPALARRVATVVCRALDLPEPTDDACAAMRHQNEPSADEGRETRHAS